MRDRAKEKIWSDFQAWCRARRLRPLPAHPWTVAAYARWCETRHQLRTIERRIEVLAEVHAARGLNLDTGSSVIVRTLRILRLRRGRKKAGTKTLFPDTDVFSQVEEGPDEAADEEGAENGKRRTLRNTPRLVRRRPASAGEGPSGR